MIANRDGPVGSAAMQTLVTIVDAFASSHGESAAAALAACAGFSVAACALPSHFQAPPQAEARDLVAAAAAAAAAP